MRTKLFTAASVAALCFSAAQAGELRIEVRNVNTGDPSETDDNEFFAGGGTLDNDTGEITVEDQNAGNPLNLSPFLNYEGGIAAHYEVDLFEVIKDTSVPTGLNSFAGDILVRYTLNGPAEWKVDENVSQYVRAGSDGIFSDGAQSLTPFVQGGKVVEAVIQTNDDDQDDDESAIGMILPIRFTECGSVTVTAEVISDAPGGNVVTRTTNTLPLAQCGSPIGSMAMGIDVFAEFESMFTAFRIPVRKGTEDGERVVPLGMITLDFPNDLTDLKRIEGERDNPEGDDTDVDERAVRFLSAGDVETYRLVLQFGDLNGITEVGLQQPEAFSDPDSDQRFTTGGNCANMLATLDRDANTATFVLDTDMFRSCFDDLTDDALDDNRTDSDTVFVAITSSGTGRMEDAIEAQVVRIAEQSIEFFDQAEDDIASNLLTGPVPLVTTPAGDGQEFARIIRSGVNFGPFDWVTTTGAVNSVFRVTGFPNEGMNTNIRGTVIVENSRNGGNGACEFDAVRNGEAQNAINLQIPMDGKTPVEFLLTKNSLNAILSDCLNGETLDDFGRADFTFSWQIKEAFADGIDMDRLLNTGGVFASYGDNSNDAYSLKARSCDPGRFGPHTANTVPPQVADELVALCRFNGAGLGLIEDDGSDSL